MLEFHVFIENKTDSFALRPIHFMWNSRWMEKGHLQLRPTENTRNTWTLVSTLEAYTDGMNAKNLELIVLEYWIDLHN